MKAIVILSILLMTGGVQTEWIDFNKASQLNHWVIVNDGVMGGLSQGAFSLNDSGNAVFYGQISLDNNGGFSSVRHRFAPMDMSSYKTIVMRLKGDGKRYQLRVKSSQYDQHSYISYFNTSGDWEIIEVSLSAMYASFRGRKLNMPDFNCQEIAELSILIANNKVESFRLELDYIHLK